MCIAKSTDNLTPLIGDEKLMKLFTITLTLLLLAMVAACGVAQLETRRAETPGPVQDMGLPAVLPQESHDDDGHGVALPGQPAGKTITFWAEEFAFYPGQVSLEAGETVNIELINEGLVDHALEFEGLEGFHLHAEPGETVIGIFTAPDLGIYRIICPIDGHVDAGMVGTLEVDMGHAEPAHD